MKVPLSANTKLDRQSARTPTALSPPLGPSLRSTTTAYSVWRVSMGLDDCSTLMI